MLNISVVMITKNAERKLAQCLDALVMFDEVVIYDNGSTDNTLEIAKSFNNVRVFEGDFLGFGKSKAYAATLATHDWVLSLDADEVASSDLVEELSYKKLNATRCYRVRRDNYYRGKHIKCCGWYPEYVVRLYNRTQTNFSDAPVHEAVQTKGLKIESLQAPIAHYSYETVADFLAKVQSYSEIYAEDMQGRKNISIVVGLGRGLFSFIKNYFFRRGVFYGFEGFVIAFFQGVGSTVKYLKLYDKNNPRK